MYKGLYLLIGWLIAATPLAHAAEANAFAVTSTAVLNEGALPVIYTCDGKDISPQLEWTSPPAKTQSYAIIMADLDATNGIFYHWILYNIPKSITKLDESVTSLPSGTLVGTNSFDKKQYSGPCPPKGASHTYVLTLYAVDDKLSLPAGANAEAVLAALKSHTIDSVEFRTTYSRWIK